MVRDNWASDYATRFASTHPSIAPAGQFEITDSIFEDFKNFIDPAKFQRDKVLETIIDRLRQAAQVEGYMTDSLSTQIDHLASMMKKPLDEELDANRATSRPISPAPLWSAIIIRPEASRTLSAPIPVSTRP